MFLIYKTRVFMRAMKKSGLSDRALRQAVSELALGLYDGDLGRGVFKKRIAAPGMGKRGSIRTIVATKAGANWFYLYGFKKNERTNISEQELEALKSLARDLYALDAHALKTAMLDGVLVEVCDGSD